MEKLKINGVDFATEIDTATMEKLCSEIIASGEAIECIVNILDNTIIDNSISNSNIKLNIKTLFNINDEIKKILDDIEIKTVIDDDDMWLINYDQYVFKNLIIEK